MYLGEEEHIRKNIRERSSQIDNIFQHFDIRNLVFMDTKVFGKIADMQKQIVEDVEKLSSFPLVITDEGKDLAKFAHLARLYQEFLYIEHIVLTRLNVSFKEANIDEKGAGAVGKCSGENEDC